MDRMSCAVISGHLYLNNVGLNFGKVGLCDTLYWGNENIEGMV